MSGPFPVISPIKQRDIGGDGRVGLVLRHYEKIKVGQLLVLLQGRDRLRYCRNIVLSTY